MLSNIYFPKSLDELSFNDELTKKIKNIVKNGFQQNLIFNGIRSSGKKTRINCLLYELFGEPIYKLKIETYNLNKNVDIIYKSSNYHIEISPGDYNIHDKYIITDFIHKLAETSNIITNSYKIFIILNADKLSEKAQYALKSMIEKTYKTSKFIMTTKNYTRLIKPLRNIFLVLRCRIPKDDEISKILKNISAKVNIKTNTRSLNVIINTSKKIDKISDLLHAINIFQLSYVENRYGKYENKITGNIDNLINLIDNENDNLKNINQIRDAIYLIYTSNINITFIFTYILNHYLATIDEINVKSKILNSAAKYEYLMNLGNKEPLYLEAFILNIIYIKQISNNL